MTDNSNSRPPRKGQFQPGKSGNPRGRPKGHKNILTYLHDELAEKVEIVDKGRAKKITKAQVIAIQTVNKASTGDPKAIATILAMTRDHDDVPTNASMSVLARAEDSMVMAGIIARIQAAARPNHERDDAGALVPDHSSTDCANQIDDGSSSTGDA